MPRLYQLCLVNVSNELLSKFVTVNFRFGITVINCIICPFSFITNSSESLNSGIKGRLKERGHEFPVNQKYQAQRKPFFTTIKVAAFVTNSVLLTQALSTDVVIIVFYIVSETTWKVPENIWRVWEHFGERLIFSGSSALFSFCWLWLIGLFFNHFLIFVLCKDCKRSVRKAHFSYIECSGSVIFLLNLLVSFPIILTFLQFSWSWFLIIFLFWASLICYYSKERRSKITYWRRK